MPNYELKAQILNDTPQFLEYVRAEYRNAWAKNCLWYDRAKQDAIISETEYEAHCSTALFNLDRELYDECVRIVDADKARRKRLRKRIENMFSMGDCVFLTLTFTDDVLNNTDEHTRRVYVSRFLKSVSSCYVGNIDFGKQNGREHYHAVIVSSVDDFSSWTYGFYKAQKVNKEDGDALRLSKYVSKLTNHAIKETTKRNALIYSR